MQQYYGRITEDRTMVAERLGDSCTKEALQGRLNIQQRGLSGTKSQNYLNEEVEFIIKTLFCP